MSHYVLSCPVCKKTFEDSYLLSCPNGCQGLMRAEYTANHLIIHDSPGLFRYSDWLPVEGVLETKAEPVCYKSAGLAEHLGLKNLWIVFSGYWPEKGAYAVTGSFKEFEAFPSVVRLRERAGGIILVSSAGNTGRAFAQVSATTGQPVIIVVPETASDRIWTTTEAEAILLITIRGDYTDAINLGNAICSIPGIYPEGGAKNIARRDGMGTVMLAGTVTSGRLPDWYVQAVGSGTGGIAAYEASVRLIRDGRYGSHMPRLFLVQNSPFIPMVRAWKDGRRELYDTDMPDAKHSISLVHSDVLTNRAPPYSIAGGVFDALTATQGIMEDVTSTEAEDAGTLFSTLEGIDPDPAASVCVAGLMKGVRNGVITPDQSVLLNITGGGYHRSTSDLPRVVKAPDLMVMPDTPFADIEQCVKKWMCLYA